MERLVITGGVGFIGSHIAEKAAREGYEVIIVDNLCGGCLGNIHHILDLDNVKLVRGSIEDIDLLTECFQGADYVCHQAAMPGVTESVRNPIKSNSINNNGTLNVLAAAKNTKIKKVVYASSSAVYGESTKEEQSEGDTPNPCSPYAVSKLSGEHYCKVFNDLYGLKTVSLRYFNVYGPRQKQGGGYCAVVPCFIESMLNGKAPTIYGEGRQCRDFVYVKDVAEANLAMIKNECTGVYNVGSGKSTKINELYEMLSRVTGFKEKALYKKTRAGDLFHSKASTKALQNAGVRASYSIEEGIRETLEWHKWEKA